MATQIASLAESYLDHLEIILRHNDLGANLRDFLDPWWVYDRQFSGNCDDRRASLVKVRRAGGYTPHTFDFICPHVHARRLDKFDFISDEAQAVINMGDLARVRNKKSHPRHLRLVVDHVVPFAALGEALFSDPHLRSRKRLKDFLQRYVLRAVITKEGDDHQRISKKQLQSRMPNGWRFWTDDPFDRYRAAGITGKRRNGQVIALP